MTIWQSHCLESSCGNFGKSPCHEYIRRERWLPTKLWRNSNVLLSTFMVNRCWSGKLLGSSVFCLWGSAVDDWAASPLRFRRRRLRHHSVASRRSVTRRFSDNPRWSFLHFIQTRVDLAASAVASSTLTATLPGNPLSLATRSTTPGGLGQSKDTSSALPTSTISNGFVSGGKFSSTQLTSSALPAFDFRSISEVADIWSSSFSVCRCRWVFRCRRYLGRTRARSLSPRNRIRWRTGKAAGMDDGARRVVSAVDIMDNFALCSRRWLSLYCNDVISLARTSLTQHEVSVKRNTKYWHA